MTGPGTPRNPDGRSDARIDGTRRRLLGVVGAGAASIAGCLGGGGGEGTPETTASETNDGGTTDGDDDSDEATTADGGGETTTETVPERVANARPWRNVEGGPASRNYLSATGPDELTKLWAHEVESDAVWTAAGPLVGNQVACLKVDGRTFRGVDLATGETAWEHEIEPGGDGREGNSPVFGTPVLSGGNLVFSMREEPGILRAVDLESGDEEWTAKLDGEDPDHWATPVATESALIAPGGDPVRVDPSTGDRIRTYEYARANGLPTCYVLHGRLYATYHGGRTYQVVAFDLESGETLGSREVPASFEPTMADGTRVYFRDPERGRLLGYDPTTENPPRELQPSGRFPAVAADGDRIYQVTRNGGAAAFSPSDGELLARYQGGFDDVAVTSDRVYEASHTNLRAYDKQGTKVGEGELDLSDPYDASIAVTGGRLYAMFPGHGLYAFGSE